MRRLGVERDAAPARRGSHPRLPGGRGFVVRAHYGALPRSGWTGTGKAGESPPDGGELATGNRASGPAACRRKYGAPAKNRRHGAPKGDAIRNAALARRIRSATCYQLRLSARHPPRLRGGQLEGSTSVAARERRRVAAFRNFAHAQLSSPGLTGRPSKHRQPRFSTSAGVYWVPAYAGTTAENAARDAESRDASAQNRRHPFHRVNRRLTAF